MPLLNVKVIEGVFTTSQKHEMIRKLTDAMVSIEGESLRPVTWVVIDEVKKRRLGDRRKFHHYQRCVSPCRRQF